MKLMYRIKKWEYPFAKTCYISQYRILGIWLNINNNQIGTFIKHNSVLCETYEEAKKRIYIHRINMERAIDHINRVSSIIYESKE